MNKLILSKFFWLVFYLILFTQVDTEVSETKLIHVKNSMRYPCIWKICSKPLGTKIKTLKSKKKMLTLLELKMIPRNRCPRELCWFQKPSYKNYGQVKSNSSFMPILKSILLKFKTFFD